MEKLDLHGVRHTEARNEVIRFIERHWDSDKLLHIVTGHSPIMKAVVQKVAEEYDLKVQDGDFLGINKGFVRIQLP